MEESDDVAYFVMLRRARYHQTAHGASNINHRGNTSASFNDAANEYQLYTEHTVLGAALNRLMSSNTRDSTSNSLDEARLPGSEGVSIVSAPKNVKFLIPLGRSGVTSNESTYGLVESTTRTITHVKDIFPFNPTAPHPSMVNQGGNTATGSSSSHSAETSEIYDQEQQQQRPDNVKSDSEEAPLLRNENSNPR